MTDVGPESEVAGPTPFQVVTARGATHAAVLDAEFETRGFAPLPSLLDSWDQLVAAAEGEPDDLAFAKNRLGTAAAELLTAPLYTTGNDFVDSEGAVVTQSQLDELRTVGARHLTLFGPPGRDAGTDEEVRDLVIEDPEEIVRAIAEATRRDSRGIKVANLLLTRGLIHVGDCVACHHADGLHITINSGFVSFGDSKNVLQYTAKFLDPRSWAALTGRSGAGAGPGWQESFVVNVTGSGAGAQVALDPTHQIAALPLGTSWPDEETFLEAVKIAGYAGKWKVLLGMQLTNNASAGNIRVDYRFLDQIDAPFANVELLVDDGFLEVSYDGWFGYSVKLLKILDLKNTPSGNPYPTEVNLPTFACAWLREMALDWLTATRTTPLHVLEKNVETLENNFDPNNF